MTLFIINLGYSQDLRIFHLDKGSGDSLTFAQVCERVKKAGYTHITYSARIDENDWENGEYNNGTNMKDDLVKHWMIAHGKGLRLIPSIPGPNRHAGNFYAATKDTNIYYEPIQYFDIKEDIANKTKLVGGAKFLAATIDYTAKLISPLFGPNFMQFATANHVKVSNCPSVAPGPDSFIKSFRSYVNNAIRVAWNEVQNNINDSSYTCDIVHIAFDEPIEFNALVERNHKLLVGKSQEDLKYLYDSQSHHFDVQRKSRGSNSDYEKIIDAQVSLEYEYNDPRKRLRYYDDYYYTADYNSFGYKEGIKYLVSRCVSKMVNGIIEFMPDVKVSIYADMLDPEFIGGYLETSGALKYLKNERIDSDGSYDPISDRLILIPWTYQNCYLRDSEYKLTEARLEIEDADLKSRSWVYFTNNGKRYDPSITSRYFIDNGFKHLWLSAFENDEMYSGGVNMAKRLGEFYTNLPDSTKNKWVIGFMGATWGANPSHNIIWDQNPANEYNQPKRFNVIEYLSAAYQDHDPFSGMMYSEMVVRDSILIDSFQISNLDFMVESRDASGRFDNPKDKEVSNIYFKRILMLNEMSKKYGLDTVYTYDFSMNMNYLNNTKISYGNKFRLEGLKADNSRDGFRLPTFDELSNANVDVDVDLEFIWDDSIRIDPQGNIDVFLAPMYKHSTGEFKLMQEKLYEDPLLLVDVGSRVVRNIDKALNISFKLLEGKSKHVADKVKLYNVTVDSEAEIEFIADEIKLIPEFHARHGSELHLKLK